MTNQFYVFLKPGMTLNSSVVIRASSPQKALQIYKSEFNTSSNESDLVLFVSDSLKFHNFTLLSIVKG